ncbi:hypothetical protein F5I97DRAFT_1809262, partial [Phlebopus sp. FC_14]
TVMLAVDVSFLAVPGVIDTSSPSQQPPTITIYMSTISFVGSLLVSVILAGQINDQSRDSAGVVSVCSCPVVLSYLVIESPFPGDSLAILHSLPFALLIWAYVSIT